MRKNTLRQLCKKLLSLLLAVTLTMGLIPETAYASNSTSGYSTETDSTQNTEGTKSQSKINIPDINLVDSATTPITLTGDITEIEELREETVKHFKLEDGTCVAVQYENPVHYKDSEGKWRDINNNLIESGDEVTTSNARIKFVKKITGNERIFTLKDGEYSITMGLQGAVKKTTGQIVSLKSDEIDGIDVQSNSKNKLNKKINLENLKGSIKYENILPGTDIEYVLESYNVKENIIVKEKSDKYTYTFTLELKNLVAKMNEKGEIVLSDSKSGVAVYSIPAPTAWDSNGVWADSELLSYELKASKKGNYTLTVKVDKEWMNAEDRAYPVTIDPPISVPSSNILDLDISENSPTKNYQTSTDMYVGYDWRGYVKIKTLPTLPNSAYITKAIISLRANQLKDNYIGVHEVTTSWDATLTWEKANASSPQGKMSDTPLDYAHLTTANAGENNRFEWDITAVAKKWYEGTLSNYGVAFKPVDGTPISVVSKFATVDASDSATHPKFILYYKDMKGLEDYWSYIGQDAGLAGTGNVNVATGILTFSNALLSTTASLMSYTPTITYSSAIAGAKNNYPNTQVSYWGSYMPYGFKININETLIQKSFLNEEGVSVSYYIWSDGDGTEHYFLPIEGETNLYRDEDGLGLTLKVEASICKITDDDKNVREFLKLSGTASGEVLSAWYLYDILDKNGNKVVFTFETGPRPMGVSIEPYNTLAIAFLEIGYNSSYFPSVICNPTTGEAMIFKYSSTPTGSVAVGGEKYLREIVYVRADDFTKTDWKNYYTSGTNASAVTIDATVYYTYDTSGRLISAKDGLSNYEVKYTYNGLKVDSVTEVSKGVTGDKATISYYNGYTEVRTSGTDDTYGTSDDLYTRYVCDAEGRVISTYVTNLARTEIYGGASSEYEEENKLAANNIKSASTSEGDSPNYILNGDFEKSDTSLIYWYTSGNATLYDLKNLADFGHRSAYLKVSNGGESSIMQCVRLTSGEYFLSFDANVSYTSDITLKVTAQSLTDTTRVFEEEIPYNKLYSSVDSNLIVPITLKFSANASEVFAVSIAVTGGTTLTGTNAVYIDNVMLSKANINQGANMVLNGDFENTSVDTGKINRYTPSTFWKAATNSNSSDYSFVSQSAPFNNVLCLPGVVGGKCVVQSVVYTAPEWLLEEYTDGTDELTNSERIFKVSGFGMSTSVMNSKNSSFAIALEMDYYSDNATQTVTKRYEFSKDTTNWQYVSGTFTVPAGICIKEIRVKCIYEKNVGTAYFDNISVVMDTSGTTVNYKYNSIGKISSVSNGLEENVYVYYSFGEPKLLISKDGVTYFGYDDKKVNVVSQIVYKYTNSLNYKSGFDEIEAGYESLAVKNTTINSYSQHGQVIQTYVNEKGENSTGSKYITKYDYHATKGPDDYIFGALEYSTDSLGRITRYFYDTTNGRLLAEIGPDNKGTCYNYDAIGNLKKVTPATYSNSTYSEVQSGANVKYNYNSYNELQSIIVGDETTSKTTYNFTYNNFGLMNSVAVGTSTIVSRTYNKDHGKLASVTYANGTTITYTYDKLERLIKEQYNNNGNIVTYEYSYDKGGRLTSQTDSARNVKTLYRYDNGGRLIGYVEYDMLTDKNTSGGLCIYDQYSRTDKVYHYQGYKYSTSTNGILSSCVDYDYTIDGNLARYFADNIEGDYYITPSYDEYNRVIYKDLIFKNSTASINGRIYYSYLSNNGNTSELVSMYQSSIGSGSTKQYKYTYNDNNNITEIRDSSGNILVQYGYDSLGQLVRENNSQTGRTYIYSYDNAGNILYKKVYNYTIGTTTPSTLYASYSYTYGDSNWKDKLTAYNGGSITYDAIGNPLSYYNGSRMTMSWTNGRRLASVVKNNVTTTYTYNDSGIRTSKIVGGVKHTYVVEGSLILSEEFDNKLIVYIYDENGAPLGMMYRVNSYASGAFDCYLFEKNLQGDITGIFNESGQQIVTYKYDAWGNLVSVLDANGATITSTTHIGLINPFRYRGYYYDNETGFYYVSSRYYDPEIGRWINGDSVIAGVSGSIQGYNMFAYCFNNPVNMSDSSGHWPQWIKDAANWVNNNIIQPVASFVERTIDYLTPPSKEDHYNRNRNNVQFPEEYDERFFKEWDDSVSANCHQFSSPNRDNVKYVSPDGRYEVIYDVSNKLVTDPRDVGTYNFVSPNEDPIGHFIKDVIPWIQHGNSPDDSTEWWQRALSFIAIYE